MNIAHHLIRAGRVRGNQPAVARGAQVVLTYAALAERVARLAGAFGALSLSAGDRVGLLLKNCVEYPELLYACWHAGLVAVPINAKLHPSEFAFIIENSGARVCFATPDIASDIASVIEDSVRLIEVETEEYRALVSARHAPLCPRGPNDPAWLFYTSGTTGRPKGATLTHRNLLAAMFCYCTDVDPGAPWGAMLHAAPMSHGSGLYGLAHTMQASCHVIPEGGAFEPAEVYSCIQHWPNTSFFAAPTMVKRLLDYPTETNTSNLKTLLYGGGPMYVEDLLDAIERYGPKLAQIYGQGETPMTITCVDAGVHADNQHPRWRERLGSVGVAQSVVEVQVADPEDKLLPGGETGEIIVRGDTVMSGYWENREASIETLRNGWLHTGDMGVFDQDGFLTLKDRSKDVIISGGTNIYPREVEEVLARDANTAEVSVIGVPDREWGEVVVAFVVAKRNCSVDTGALEKLCLENMARFKRPKSYRIVDALPKNNYGKILKTALRELAKND